VEEPERELLQAPVPRGNRRLADVAAVAPRPRDRFPVGVEGLRDRLLDRQGIGAGPQSAGEGLDDVLRFDRRGAPQEIPDHLLLQHGFLERREAAQRLVDLENRKPTPSPPGRGMG
jgi:hypothetical protein